MSADDIKLLPCPFCGGSAHLEEHPPHQHVIIDMPYHAGSATVECGGCEAGMIAETAGAVADAWNRRAPSPQGDAPAYRLLDRSDIIQRGDEFLDDDCVNWNGIAGWEAGMLYNPVLLKAGRRQIDADSSTPATEKGES
ncbi:Lar family restriction alleviation protein [Pigmentiphaga sp.]|uniref:Lar family restriction alleviation protein n=1 Tax=Pigmentiphaga sp. TaxID=1977564 RepID=UPI0025E5255F|nr:Lar family restriction alleviation protein [Pigmentiphaga sp.]